jgi:excisionase family DNA binding protein
VHVANRLGISVKTVRRWYRDGKIEVRKEGQRLTLISWMSVLRYLDREEDD